MATGKLRNASNSDRGPTCVWSAVPSDAHFDDRPMAVRTHHRNQLARCPHCCGWSRAGRVGRYRLGNKRGCGARYRCGWVAHLVAVGPCHSRPNGRLRLPAPLHYSRSYTSNYGAVEFRL